MTGHATDFQEITGRLARDNGAIPARVLGQVLCAGMCRDPARNGWSKVSLLSKLEKSVATGVKHMGGDAACRELKVLLAVTIDGGSPNYGMVTRSFGAGIASVVVASQAVLKFVPVDPLFGDPFDNVVLQMCREPFVEHHRTTRLTPYAMDGQLDIVVKADFLARMAWPDSPFSAACAFLSFDWSDDQADEVIVRGKLAAPYSCPSLQVFVRGCKYSCVRDYVRFLPRPRPSPILLIFMQGRL